MSWKPTLWLLTILVLTGVFILVFEKGAEPAPRSIPVDMPLVHVSQGAVTRLSIATGTGSVECVRRDGGEWFLTRPVEMRASRAKVDRLIEAIATMRRQEVVDSGRREKRGLTLASFGLESPRARYVVGGELRADEILLGDSAPLGELVYVQLNGGSDVIGVTCKLAELFPVDLDGLRDHAVFPDSIRQAARVELKHAGGFLQLAMREGAWRIQQPFDARADGTRVERLLQSLGGLTIKDFSGGSVLADPSAYGLGVDEAALQISLWIEGRREPLVLTVGKARQDDPSLLYAKISDMAAICSISKDVLSLQTVKATSLRDRRLCEADPATITAITLRDGDLKVVMEKNATGKWMITEPLRFAANIRAVGSLLRTVSTLQADEILNFGITNPIPLEASVMPCRLTMATVSPVHSVTNDTAVVSPADVTWSYRLAAPASGSSNSQVFCEESKTMFRVHADDLARLWVNTRGQRRALLSDPLSYMDCRMLDLNSQQVRRITLARQGREETVTASADGVWTVDSPPDGQMVEGAIPAVLALAADLQADRVESITYTNAATYGFGDSATRITFGLSGASGIQKTILIGQGDGRDGVYSMVQGQDVIFVLKKEVADALTHPLVTSP